MIWIGVEVQDADAGGVAYRACYARDLLQIPALTEVWYGLEEFGQGAHLVPDYENASGQDQHDPGHPQQAELRPCTQDT